MLKKEANTIANNILGIIIIVITAKILLAIL